MTIEAILAQIDGELVRLQQARALLSGNGTANRATDVPTKAPVNAGTRKRRVFSAESRKRIADAQRKRWGAQKKAAAAKKAAKTTSAK